MNSTALLNYYYEHSGEQVNNINDLVAHSLIHIVHKYLMQMTSSLVLTLCCRNSHTCNFYNEMLQKLFHLWGETPTQIIFKHHMHTPRVSGRRSHNLILVDSYKSFIEIDIAAHTHDYNYNEYYHIFLQQRDYLIPITMQRIFEYCWRHQLINCNIQTQSARGVIEVYTYYPFSELHCNRVVRRLINSFNGTALIYPVLFPRKLLNFHGCSLRAAIWDVPPFLYLKRDKCGRSRIVGGFEGQLLRELANKLNFSVALQVPPHNEQRGVIKEGGMANGALGMLQRNEVELSLGSFRQNRARSLIATATNNHYQTRQVLCLFVAAYELSSIDVLLYPFPVLIWCALLLIFLLVTLHDCVSNRILGHLLPNVSSHPCLNVLLLFVALMLFTLIVRTIYQGLLYHLVRTHQSNPMPTTIFELVRENYTIVLTQNTNDALSEVIAIQTLTKIIVANANEKGVLEILASSRNRRYGAIIPLAFLKHYSRMNMHWQNAFKVMPQNLFSMQVTMYLTKHSFLLNEFNEQINWMSASGLIVAWLREEFGNNYELQKHINQDYENLGMQELSASFWLIIIAYVLAITIFVLERMSLKFDRLRYIFLNV